MSEALTEKLELVAEGNASDYVESFTDNLLKMVKGLGVAEVAYAAVGAVIGKLIAVGVQENAAMNEAVRATATLNETVFKYVGVENQRVAAVEDSIEAMERLSDAQFKVKGGEEELFALYQKLLPAMAQAGETSTEKMTNFVTLVAQVADVTKQGYQEVGGELTRLIITGQVARGETSKLLQALGVTPDQVRSWKQAGTLVDELSERLKIVGRNAKESLETMGGQSALIKKAFAEIVEVAEKGTFDNLFKGALTSIRSFLVTVGEDGKVTLNQSIIVPLRSFFQSFSAVVSSVASVIGSVFSAAGAIVKTFVSILGGSGVDWIKTLSSAFLSSGEIIVHVLGYLKIGFLTIAEIVKASAGTLVSFTAGLMQFGANVYSFIGGLADKFPKVTEALSNFTGIDISKVGETFKQASATFQDAADHTSAGLDKNYSLVEALGKIVDDTGAEVKKQIGGLEVLKNRLSFPGLAANVLDTDRLTESIVKAGKAAGQMNDQQRSAMRNLADLVEKTDLALRAGGLSGYAKEMAELEQKIGGVNLAFEQKVDAIKKDLGLTKEMAAAIEILRGKMDTLTSAYREQEKARIALDNALKFGIALAEMNAQNNMDPLAKMRADQLKNEAEIRRAHKEALDLLSTDDVEYAEKKKAIDEASAAAKIRGEQNTTLAMRAESSKRVKDYETEFEALKAQALLAGKSVVEAVQGALKQVAQDAYDSALSIADGVRAGMLQIAATVKTEGQSMADAMTSFWQGAESSFVSFLDSVEHGTGSLKDLLKGIFDSILKSFNQMVADMVKRWLFGQQEMSEGGSGGSGAFSGLLGSLFKGATATGTGTPVAQGWAPVYGQNGAGPYQTSGNASWASGGVPVGSSGGFTATGAVAGAGMGVGIGSLVGGMSGSPGFSTGATIGGALAGVGLSMLSTAALASVATAIGLGAAAGSVIPILGTIIGAIIGGLIGVLSASNTESKVFGRDFAPQIKQVVEGVQGTMIDVFSKSLLPDKAAFVKDLNKRLTSYLSYAAGYEVHAGSAEDIQGDIKTLLTGVIPSELLHLMIGQKATGGKDIAGISGGKTYGGTLDPDAPLNKMLTDLGFTAGKVQALAASIDSTDPTEWMKQLMDLVDTVAQLNEVKKNFKKTFSEIVADDAAEQAKSPAAKLATAAAALKTQLQDVALYTGAEQIQKGKDAAKAAADFFESVKSAMLQLAAMSKQVQRDVTDMTRSVANALKTPAELFAQSFSDLQNDYQAMRDAGNPAELSAAWERAKTDFTSVANVLVARIQAIKSTLADIATLRDAIANGPGADAMQDPQAWLQQNTTAIAKYRDAMTAANPGSPEQIAAAQTFSGLLRDRYNMELQMLERVKSAIQSVNQTIDEALFGIDMGEAKNPSDKAALVMGKINDLYAQLQQAKTPEEVNRLVSQITGLTNQLYQLSPVGSAGHDQVVAFVREILGKVRGEANSKLGGMQQAAEFDISTIGPQLAAAETILKTALDKATTDLEALVWHFQRAGDFMTGKLNDWGVELGQLLTDLSPIIATTITNFTDVNSALSGTTTTGGGGKHGPDGPLGQNLTDFGSGLSDAAEGLAAFTGALNGPGGGRNPNASGAPPPANVTVTVTATSPDPADIADQVWAELVPALTNAFESNNAHVYRKVTTGNG